MTQQRTIMARPAAVRLTDSRGVTFACDWATWQAREETVLVVVRRGEDVLLMEKKQGFGTGKITVPGGRIEHGETPAEAAVRETNEEVALTPTRLVEAGVLHFAFTGGHGFRTTVFVCEAFGGTPSDSPEARPFWSSVAALPYGAMWADDRLWLPLLLTRRYFTAWFIFEDDVALWHQLQVRGDDD